MSVPEKNILLISSNKNFLDYQKCVLEQKGFQVNTLCRDNEKNKEQNQVIFVDNETGISFFPCLACMTKTQGFLN